MRTKTIRLICLLGAALITASLSSCKEEDGADGSFYAVIPSDPKNLDPQLAADRESYFVIRNIYATLTDINSEGEAVMGAAESYTLSEDGLTYTFTLRDGLVWQGISGGGQPLTAYDYEFAFRRIFSRSTDSPHRERYSDIKNSGAVFSGERPVTALGVHASDEHTLTIELEKPDCEFLKKLAHPSASPCNEELFLSAQGRYGLSAEDTYGCGAFYITDWNYDPYWTENHIYLERIAENSKEGYETFPRTVSIAITDDRESFESEENVLTDGFSVMSHDEYDKSMQKNYDCKEYECGTTMLIFSPDSVFAGDLQARKAVAWAIDREKLASELTTDSVPASRIVPAAVTLGFAGFRELYPDTMGGSRVRSMRSEWDNFVSAQNGLDINSSEILVSDSIHSPGSIYSAVSDMEELLDFYPMPVFCDDEEFASRLRSGDYDICAFTLYSENNSADELISALTESMGIPDADPDSYLKKLGSSAETSDKFNTLCETEEYILENAYAVPLSYEKRYFIFRNNVSDLWYDPFSDIIYYKYAKQW